MPERPSPTTVTCGSATHVGKVREMNEDGLIAGPSIFAVADGMGGHDAGEVASAMVIETLERLGDEPLNLAQVADALESVNRQVFGRASAVDGHLVTMGTTASGLALVDNGGSLNWMLFNVGDSRVYRIFEASIEQLSHDHSHVQELVDAGRISEEQARSHPERNVVTQAIGIAESTSPDYRFLEPTHGERFIICTDGLYGEIHDREIIDIAERYSEPTEAAQALVDAALDAGGHDNVTVVVVDVGLDVVAGEAPADTVIDVFDAVEVTSPRAEMEPEIASVPVASSSVAKRPEPQTMLIDEVPKN